MFCAVKVCHVGSAATGHVSWHNAAVAPSRLSPVSQLTRGGGQDGELRLGQSLTVVSMIDSRV